MRRFIYVALFLLSSIKQGTSLVPTTPTTPFPATFQWPSIWFAQHLLPPHPVSMATTSQTIPTVYAATHTTVAPVMQSQGRLGHHSMYQYPELGQHQMQQFAATQYQQQQQMSTSEAGSAGSSSCPSPYSSHYRSAGSVTGMPQSVAAGPSLALSQAQAHYTLHQQQQQMALFHQWYAMMQGAMLGLHPLPMMTQEQYRACQTALQGTQVQQLRPMEQMAQQSTTPEVGVVQQAMAHQSPPHLTLLQDSSVGQTPCQSVSSQVGSFPTGAVVGVDGGAVDPPTQGEEQCVLRLG